ncbi:hypothetical protein [Agrobacterium sp. DE0009]|nr:hypothetical protein [Agrobacterium sp. DE0009]
MSAVDSINVFPRLPYDQLIDFSHNFTRAQICKLLSKNDSRRREG